MVREIARQGCTVIIPYREEMAKRHLKVAGDLGRVVFMVRSWIEEYRDYFVADSLIGVRS